LGVWPQEAMPRQLRSGQVAYGDQTEEWIIHASIEPGAKRQQLSGKLIIIDAHAIDQLATLMSRVAHFEHGVASQLILEIRAVVLHVSVGVIAVVAAGAASYIGQQPARLAHGRDQSV